MELSYQRAAQDQDIIASLQCKLDEATELTKSMQGLKGKLAMLGKQALRDKNVGHDKEALLQKIELLQRRCRSLELGSSSVGGSTTNATTDDAGAESDGVDGDVPMCGMIMPMCFGSGSGSDSAYKQMPDIGESITV